MPKYLLWSNNDPNDAFEVEADTPENAAFAALSELGWSMGDGGEDGPECEDCGVEMTEDESLDAFAAFNRIICEDCEDAQARAAMFAAANRWLEQRDHRTD